MARERCAAALADAPARRRALLDHETSLFVEAGAGSGKTAVMAGRIALMFANGIMPRDVVAITFTEAAAAELLERIERFVRALVSGTIPPELELVLPDGFSPQQKKAIEAASLRLDEITCTTIHGFCQQLIRPYPVEAGLDPGARIIDPSAADLAYRDLMMAWLMTRFGRDRGTDGLGRIPPIEGLGGEEDFFAELLVGDPDAVVRLVEATAQFLRDRRGAQAPAAAVDTSVLASFCSAISAFAAWYDGCGLLEEATQNICADLTRLKIEIETAREPIGGRVLAQLLLHTPPICRHSKEARFNNWNNKRRWQDAAMAAGFSRPRGDQLSDRAKTYYERCSEHYQAFVTMLTDAALARFIAEFDRLRELYRDYKRQAALLDFDDLLHHARDLVSERDEIRRALARRYPRILVDEFQDTDRLQAEILWLLCGEGNPTERWSRRILRPGSLLIVGDPKQAIYRFRGADVDTYLEAKQSIYRPGEADVDTYLEAKRAVLERDPTALLEITANFRSLPTILKFVNDNFGPLLSVEQGQPGFTTLTETRKSGEARPAVARFDVEIGERHKNEKGQLITGLVRREEAGVVAELVRRLIGTYTVWDRHMKTMRPCRAGDIALLAPTGTDLWMYERALDDRGIPLASQAGKGFFRRQEVQDLIAIARTVADVRDTLALGALLRGPLVGLTEEDIADSIAALPAGENGAPGRLHLYTDLQAITNPVLARTLEILQSLGRKTRTTVPYQIMAEAIDELNVRPILSARHPRSTERALANVELFLEMARPYDVRGLQAFVADLRRNWEEGEAQIEGRPDAESEAVSIITIHSAKGLEWPIVIPINSMTRFREDASFLHRRSDNTVHFKLLGHEGSAYEDVKNEELAQFRRERVRLWYVALTRACDLLLLPNQSERTPNDWMSLIGLNTAELPVFACEQTSRAATPAFEAIENQQDETTWHREAATIADMRRKIVWKAPSSHQDFDRMAKPEESEIFAAEPADVAGDTVIPLPPRGSIQGGRERGLVLHKLIEEILNGETQENEAALTARAGELLVQLGACASARPDEGPHPPELATTALRALAIPDVAALRPRLRPEVSVFSAHADGASVTYVGGVADAVVYEDGRVSTVIDWKSDVDPSSEQVDIYRGQIRDYLATTGAREGLLIFVTSTRLVRIPNEPPGKAIRPG
jgi:exodeoxyribonuclease-5